MAAGKDPPLHVDMQRLQREVERIAGRLSDIVDDVDEVASHAHRLVRRVSPGADVVPPRSRRVRPSPEEKSVMRAEAAAGASTLETFPTADGSSEVCINGRGPMRLPPGPAALLAVLVASPRHAEDGLLGWQSNAEVAAGLTARGRTASATAVPKLVYRLRMAFHAAGENWLLVQTNRERGVRFALRAPRSDGASPAVAPACSRSPAPGDTGDRR